MLYADFHTARRSQLVGVNLRSHAPSGSRFEHTSRLLWREEATVAEHVDEVGEMLATHFGYHLVDDELHVVALRHAASHGVRSEERRHNLCRRRLLHALYDAQHLQLVLEVQSVAALYLYAARSLAYHLVESLHRLAEQLVLRSVVQQVG